MPVIPQEHGGRVRKDGETGMQLLPGREVRQVAKRQQEEREDTVHGYNQYLQWGVEHGTRILGITYTCENGNY